MVNKVILLGNIGKDAEQVSDSVTKFSLATTDHWTDKNTGQRVEKTEWHRITVLGKLAPVMFDLCKKGRKAYVEGKLVTNEWEKDGEKRYSTDIVVDFGGKIEITSSLEKSESGNSNYTPAEKTTPPAAKTGKPKETKEESAPVLNHQPDPIPDATSDDDIPF